MALTPQQKALRELEGDEPEFIAWNLMEWIRLVEQAGNRNEMLDIYSACLKTVREGVEASAAEASEPANGIQRKLGFKLLYAIAELEGRDLGQRNQGNRAWILETFAECLAAVMGKRVAVVVPEVAVPVAEEVAG